MRIRADIPTGTNMRAKVAYVGMTDARLVKTPKAKVAATTSRGRGRSRRAANKAPVSEPTAMIDPSRPNSPAPLLNTDVAISAIVIWKLNAKVPTKPTMAIIRTMSGRPRTYRRPSRSWPLARAAFGGGASSLTRIRVREMSTATKDSPLITNTGPVPTQAMSRPASAGPMTRAA